MTTASIGPSSTRHGPRRILGLGLTLLLSASSVACAAQTPSSTTSSPPSESTAASPSPASAPASAPAGPSNSPDAGAAQRSAIELAGPTGPTTTARVTKVVDGDTIHVEFADGVSATVRYIGIDTPETVHPTIEVEPFGPEASELNKELVEGRAVVLELDVSDTDRYDRLLRYIWLQADDGWLLVNAELLRAGLATVSTYPPDVKWIEAIYLPAQDQAQEAQRGLWSTEQAPAGSVAPSATAPAAGACHTAYEGACLPIVADLDCGDIAERNFRSIGNDPYGLDGNGDGIACT